LKFSHNKINKIGLKKIYIPNLIELPQEVKKIKRKEK